MSTFFGNQALKDQYVAQLRAHHEADEIIKGRYWENGKGCAVGCLVHQDSPHALFPERFGIPVQIAYLVDRLFENLPNVGAKNFAVEWFEAVPVGEGLDLVTSHFLVWLLSDPQDGGIRFAKSEQSKSAIEHVATLYRRKIAGEEIEKEEWGKAAYSADAAAYAAAAYADAYAAYAYAAAAAAADAADAAAAADAADAAAADAYAADAYAADAKSEHYRKMAAKLIELLKAATVAA